MVKKNSDMVKVQWSNGTLTVLIDGYPHQIDNKYVNYKRICKLTNEPGTHDEIRDLLNIQVAGVPRASVLDGALTQVGTQFFYRGQPLHNTVTERILDFMREGLPTLPLVNFLRKIMENPSYKSREQLYGFLAHKGLPLDEDGDFYAYKAIREDWYDKWTGTVLNKPGCAPEMPRSEVDDESSHHCSKGYHCGAMDYVTWYGGGDDRVVLVKVNPADAVCVPCDHSWKKLRVCKYLVVKEYEGDLVRPVYTGACEDVQHDYDEGYSYTDDFDNREEEDDSVAEDRFDDNGGCCGGSCEAENKPKGNFWSRWRRSN